MKTRVIHNYQDIVMQIELVVLWIGDLHQVIVSSLEGILFLGRARSKLLLLGPVQKLNIDPWQWLNVSSCGLNSFCRN